MTAWLDARVAEIRDRMTPDDEGSHWTIFFADPDGEPVVASAVDSAMDEMDRELLRHIAMIIKRMPAPACLIAVVRLDGNPQPVDRWMWRELREVMRASDKRLLGFVVVGTSTHWWASADDDLGSAA